MLAPKLARAILESSLQTINDSLVHQWAYSSMWDWARQSAWRCLAYPPTISGNGSILGLRSRSWAAATETCPTHQHNHRNNTRERITAGQARGQPHLRGQQ